MFQLPASMRHRDFFNRNNKWVEQREMYNNVLSSLDPILKKKNLTALYIEVYVLFVSIQLFFKIKASYKMKYSFKIQFNIFPSIFLNLNFPSNFSNR